MGRVIEVKVAAVPARLKIYLRSQAVDTVRIVEIMCFWNVVSLVYAAETYPVSHRPCVHVCQCSLII